MQKILHFLAIALLIFNLLFISQTSCLAQAGCTPQTPVGVNLITNGDFEQGYTDLTTDYFNHFTQSTANGFPCVKGSDCNPPDPTKACGCNRDYSVPNEFLIGKDVTKLHVNFIPITDHTSGVIGGGQTLFVDGSCSVKKANGTDYTVWSRTVNIVPNTNYFFSSWVASLGVIPTLDPGQVAVLVFKVNGDSIGTLPATAKVGEWVSYTRNYFSGNISGPVTISIVNTKVVTCNNGDDFAIDDITFTAGCAFASFGPKPNLGLSFSICDKKLPITLSSGIKPPYTNINIKWSTGETTPTIKISAGGTYSVCVDSAGSCTRSDIIKITDNFVANIGPDIRLCNPLYAVLKSNIIDSTNFNSIQWLKDGVAIDRADNFTSLLVNEPGTYVMKVNGPGNCSSTAKAVVTTGVTTIPVNDTYCVASGKKTANLSVTGPSTIKWYAAETGGVALAKGPTYTTPILTSPGPFTYWAEDTTSFSGKVGESGAGFTTAGYPGTNQAKETKLKFDALAGFRLDSLTVGYYSYNCSGTTPMTISILDANGAVVGSKTVTVPCKGVDPSFARVAIGIDIPKGINYTITSDKIDWNLNGPPNWYPKTYLVNGNNVLKITGNLFDVNYAQWSSPSYWDWKVSVGAACGRVPVYANEVCSCKPVIITNPHDTSACSGGVSFKVVVKGTAPSFVWQEKTPASGVFANLTDGGVYSGVNTTVLSISSVLGKDKNQYRCVATGTCGSATSTSATLSLSSVSSILTQPRDTNLCGTGNINFKVLAQGGGLTYKWLEKKPGGAFIYLTDIGKYAGTTTNNLMINGADSSMSGNTYQVEIASPCAPTISSNPARITVIPSKITIVTQPTNNTVCQGATAQFTLKANGAGLTYKWQEKTTAGVFTNINSGGPYSGADSSTLNISNVMASMNGNQYRCVVTGPCSGKATSLTDTLNIIATPALSLGKDTVYCPVLGSSYVLSANPGYKSYLWQDNSTGPNFLVLQPGTYTVTGTLANGCKSNASIIVKDCDKVFIPNVITPFNHDGKNDVFFITGNRPGSTIEIYNRWGTLIQKKNSYSNDWAGEDMAGNPVSAGIYFYIYTPQGKGTITGNIEVLK